MLGSSIIEVWIEEDGKETKIVFTGDLGNNDIPLLSSPTMIEDADYLVMESTYGDRLHVGTDDKAKVFLDIVSETLVISSRLISSSRSTTISSIRVFGINLNEFCTKFCIILLSIL